MINQSNLILLVLQALRDSGPALRDLGNGINADTGTTGTGSGSNTDKKTIFVTIDGEWVEGRPHGRGVYTWPSGARYDGEYERGDMHGYGVKIYADGRVERGQWRNDRFQG